MPNGKKDAWTGEGSDFQTALENACNTAQKKAKFRLLEISVDNTSPIHSYHVTIAPE